MGASGLVTWRDFGPFLRRLRVQLGMTQEQLAANLSCNRIHVYRLECGHRHPSRVLLRLIAQTCAFDATAANTLKVFEFMAEHHCDEVEAELASLLTSTVH